MGEGIFEATITKWLINVGDQVNEDDSLVEIATDKVDSEVPAPVSGVVKETLVQEGEVAKVGQIIAIIEAEDINEYIETKHATHDFNSEIPVTIQETHHQQTTTITIDENHPKIPVKLTNGSFLSPLVRSIAYKEGLTTNELERINGSGLNGRIIKDDLIAYLNTNKPGDTSNNQGFEVIEMDRMRKIIADNMVQSKQISPHVTSFHEADVTSMVHWRNDNKNTFQKKYGHKITFTPLFIEAICKAIEKFPMINVSVEQNRIIKKNNINIGMATALPNGNLIVPVIHHANKLSNVELAAKVNDLAERSRTKKLLPAEIQGGSFTITNIGSFGNLSGTPIINQPEVAILAIGSIKKRPAVIETPQGDFIGIRHQLILSLSYDHRVIDGLLGGLFLKQVADNIESFNGNYWISD